MDIKKGFYSYPNPLISNIHLNIQQGSVDNYWNKIAKKKQIQK